MFGLAVVPSDTDSVENSVVVFVISSVVVVLVFVVFSVVVVFVALVVVELVSGTTGKPVFTSVIF